MASIPGVSPPQRPVIRPRIPLGSVDLDRLETEEDIRREAARPLPRALTAASKDLGALAWDELQNWTHFQSGAANLQQRVRPPACPPRRWPVLASLIVERFISWVLCLFTPAAALSSLVGAGLTHSFCGSFRGFLRSWLTGSTVGLALGAGLAVWLLPTQKGGGDGVELGNMYAAYMGIVGTALSALVAGILAARVRARRGRPTPAPPAQAWKIEN